MTKTKREDQVKEWLQSLNKKILTLQETVPAQETQNSQDHH